MNHYIARSGTCRVVGFERADSLVYLAKMIARNWLNSFDASASMSCMEEEQQMEWRRKRKKK
jgi:hypothetical protein